MKGEDFHLWVMVIRERAEWDGKKGGCDFVQLGPSFLIAGVSYGSLRGSRPMWNPLTEPVLLLGVVSRAQRHCTCTCLGSVCACLRRVGF